MHKQTNTQQHTRRQFSLCVCVWARLQAPSVVVRPALTWPRPLLMVEHERECGTRNSSVSFTMTNITLNAWELIYLSKDILLSLTIFLSVLFSILLLWLLASTLLRNNYLSSVAKLGHFGYLFGVCVCVILAARVQCEMKKTNFSKRKCRLQ